MKEIPGFTIRDQRTGALRGFKCPISFRQFFGPDAERRQYEHTKEIADKIDPNHVLSIPAARQIHIKGIVDE